MAESGKDDILLINNRAVVKRLVLIVYGRSLEGCPEGE